MLNAKELLKISMNANSLKIGKQKLEEALMLSATQGDFSLEFTFPPEVKSKDILTLVQELKDNEYIVAFNLGIENTISTYWENDEELKGEELNVTCNRATKQDKTSKAINTKGSKRNTAKRTGAKSK